MRLDKFLKVSRLIKRRTVANAVCGQGRVFLNGKPSKPSTTVKEADEIEIEYASRSLKVKILSVPTGNVSIQKSKELYEVVNDTDNIIEQN